MAQLFQEPSLQLTALQILCNFEDASLIQKKKTKNKTQKQNNPEFCFHYVVAYFLHIGWFILFPGLSPGVSHK